MTTVKDVKEWLNMLKETDKIYISYSELALALVENRGIHIEIGGIPSLHDWKYAVEDNETILGYHEWLKE